MGCNNPPGHTSKSPQETEETLAIVVETQSCGQHRQCTCQVNEQNRVRNHGHWWPVADCCKWLWMDSPERYIHESTVYGLELFKILVKKLCPSIIIISCHKYFSSSISPLVHPTISFIICYHFNSFASWRYTCNLKIVIFKLISRTDVLSIS